MNLWPAWTKQHSSNLIHWMIEMFPLSLNKSTLRLNEKLPLEIKVYWATNNVTVVCKVEILLLINRLRCWIRWNPKTTMRWNYLQRHTKYRLKANIYQTPKMFLSRDISLLPRLQIWINPKTSIRLQLVNTNKRTLLNAIWSLQEQMTILFTSKSLPITKNLSCLIIKIMAKFLNIYNPKRE